MFNQNVYTPPNKGRTATLIVAASNSSAKSKQGADYVCDGTTDNVEINAAITALGSVGGKVLLSEGTFNVASTISVAASNVTLEGQGHSTILKLISSGNTSVITVGNGNMSYIESIFIKNLKIDGNKANNTSGHGIFFDRKVYYSFIQNVHIIDTTKDGINIYATGTTNNCYCNEINSCKIENAGQDGIHVEYSHMNTITNCPTIYTSTRYGIYLQNSNSARLVNIRIAGAGQIGLYLNGNDNGQVINVNIATALTGMQLTTCSANYISGCIFENCTNIGLLLHIDTNKSVIEGNTFPYGGKILLDLNSCGDNRIINNNFFAAGQSATNTYPCIQLRGDSNYNLIHGNLFLPDTAILPNYAVYETGTADYNIIENSIVETAKFGTGIVSLAGANSKIRKSLRGYVTENKGTATVADDATSVDVTHGLSKTPVAQDIVVTPTNNLGDASFYWISDVGATTFRINIDSDPGVSTATFAWQIN